MVEFTIAGVDGGVCAPRGFRAAGVAAGLALGDGPDLALVASQQQGAVAGRFTRHRFPSAPVRWSREQIQGGWGRAVLAHSGSANAFTGIRGDEDAAALAAGCAEAFGCRAAELLLLGTGPVGNRLDLGGALDAIPRLHGALTRRGSVDVARALTASGGVVREQAVAVAWSGGEVRIGAVAKASVPFAPSFATTLVILTTDATASPGVLDRVLTRSVARSFERILVDHGPGPGDSVVLLSNATAAAPELLDGSDALQAVEAALSQLCESLAEGLAARAPGSRRLIAVTVHGAQDHDDALAAARAVAGSVSLRAALAAGVVAWPAVLDALGSCPVPFDPAAVGVGFGPVTVVADGQAAPHDAGAAAAVVAKAEVDLTIDLGAGAATVTTCDLPPAALARLAERG